jgi:predicted AlkP superfamily pyrophosphatase or phosphodiesterase
MSRVVPALTLCAVLALGAWSTAVSSGGQPSPRPRPSLVVVLVVDQMRTDYVERYGGVWTAGLRRLFFDRGAWFTEAAYPYFNTVTCAGHATIASGALPMSHGMILNQWWDRAEKRQIACTEDAAVAPVRYGPPVAGPGHSPHRVMTPMFADELRSQLFPTPRIATMSIKARSAIPLAGRKADLAIWFESGAWTTSTAYTEKPTPFLDRFIEAHPVARDRGQVWSRSAPAHVYQFEDDGIGERPPAGWTRTFPHALDGAGGDGFFDLWTSSPFADAYLTRMAIASVDELKLGQSDRVDFLGVSLSALDSVGHKFGPHSHEVQDVLINVDRAVGALFDHLDRIVGRDRYVVVLSADHGVSPIPERLAGLGFSAGRYDTGALRSAAQNAIAKRLGPGQHVARVYYTDMYLAPGVSDRLAADPTAFSGVLDELARQPGVARVFRGDQLPARRGSTDPFERAAALGYFPGRSGDIIVLPSPYWISSSDATTHGSMYGYDSRVPVVIMGPGVRAGRYAVAASPADIAPTLAAMVGVTLARADGRVLADALDHVPPTAPSQTGSRLPR